MIQEKKCYSCNLIKTKTEFYLARARKDGLTSRCKICSGAANRKWRKDNPDRYTSYSRNYYEKNREHCQEKSKRKYALDPKKHRGKGLRHRYWPELSWEQALEKFETMAMTQDYSCAICKERTKLYVDHNHATGKVRGLLCSLCNTALGHIREDAQIGKRLLEYLGVI